MQMKIESISRIILELQDRLAQCITLLEMNKEDSSLANDAHSISSRLTDMQSTRQSLNEKKADLVYEECQLANTLGFIRSHEINGCFVPETVFHEDEIMLLLEQVLVLEQGYVISFKVGKVIELLEITNGK